eukprot:COSAG06_NODE_6050_length_3134_cov_27.352883_3_plen_118_part_00
MIVLLQRVSLNNAYNVNCRAPAAAPAFPPAAALPGGAHQRTGFPEHKNVATPRSRLNRESHQWTSIVATEPKVSEKQAASPDYTDLPTRNSAQGRYTLHPAWPTRPQWLQLYLRRRN